MISAYLKLIITIAVLQLCGMPYLSDCHVIRKPLKSNNIKTSFVDTLPFNAVEDPLPKREEAFQSNNPVFGPQNQNSEPQKLQAYQEKKWLDTCPASGFHFSNQSLLYYESLDTQKRHSKPKKTRKNKNRSKTLDQNIQLYTDEEIGGSESLTTPMKTQRVHNLQLQILINDFLGNVMTLKALLDQLKKGENNELGGKRIEARRK